ncbi:MAG: RsbRD N-terminal domain-containing protein [Thermoleophilia bacterium]
MTNPSHVLILRENSAEILRRWLDDCSGRISEEYQRLLSTKMGGKICQTRLELTVKYLEAEAFEMSGVLRELREMDRESAYRRAAAGYNLTDIVNVTVSFRNALIETLMNHYNITGAEDGQEFIECIASLVQMGDAMVWGDIAGYFTYFKFCEEDDAVAGF